MTLRRKTLLIFGLTLASLVGVLWALARTVLLTGFARLEDQGVRERMTQVQTLVTAELASLGSAAGDYAYWDDTYGFMETRAPAYLDQLPRSDTTSLRVQFVALLDTSRKLVYGRSLDLEGKRDGPLPAGLEDALARGRVVRSAKTEITALVMLPDGPAFLAVRPILTSLRQGPSRGFFVFGRYVDAWQVSKLSSEANLPLVARYRDDPDLPADLLRLDTTTVLVKPRDEDSLQAYALLRDVAGRPALILSADLPRPVYAQGRASLARLTGLVLVVGLALGGFGALLFERLTLSRLRRLSSGVEGIGSAGDLSARLALPGDDELSSLADALNRMLDTLAGSQRSLRESEARLRDIVEHSTNLFFSRNPDQVLTYMSPQARAFLDVEPDAAVGWGQFLTDNPVNSEGLAHAQRALETGEREPPYELELKGKTGRRIWVEVNEAPVVHDGKTVAVVGALTDITARKRVEADKAGLEEQLRQAQKMEAVGSLAGGVAHDFNNMLGVITGFSELLSRDLGPGHKGQGRLEQIRKAAERAATLTRQLLAFGRKQTLQPTILDLNSVLTDIEKMLHRLIGEDIQLVTVLEGRLGCVRADLGQIEQVILNLAVNARDAMPQGGRLVFETKNTILEKKDALLGASPGAYVALTVSDTGHGMDEKTKARIFEPFFTTKGMGKGTGLGLSTVFGIVKQSEGYVEVESTPGRGSSFHVYLPRVADVPKASQGLGVGKPESLPHGSETVLVVEDEASLRAMVQEILTESGYAVLAVASPQAALALAATHVGPMHLLLTDVVMPHMSGREMATRLLTLRPDVRVLYMSGYTDEAMGHHGILGTDVGFIQKPFEPDALLQKVRAALDAPRRTAG